MLGFLTMEQMIDCENHPAFQAPLLKKGGESGFPVLIEV
jgi:hypothetical protein